MKRQAWLVAVMLLGSVGCAQLLQETKQVTNEIGQYGAGTYTVTAEKDGMKIVVEQWTCDPPKAPGQMPVCHQDAVKFFPK